MRVLIADDDEITRRQLYALLDHLGHEIVEADGGAAAWNAIQAENAPALIILDWMMPPPNGVEICRRLRESAKRPYQYVMMLTSRDSVDDLTQAMDAGADDYIRKPFDLRELRARLRAGERMIALQDELRAEAITDELTGLLNRRGLIERLDHELALVERDGRPLSLLMLDLDDFKAVNDTHGHGVGDETLREVAFRVNAQLRSYDDLARYGGEEFAVILPSCEASDGVTVAERIRRAVCDTPVDTSAGALNVTISIGVANANLEKTTRAQPCIAAADRALYAAKRNGRNGVEVAWSPDAAAGR